MDVSDSLNGGNLAAPLSSISNENCTEEIKGKK